MSDSIYAFNLTSQQAISLQDTHSEQDIHWYHFDYTAESTNQWLDEQSFSNNVISDSLLGDESRPRVSKVNGGVLMSFRGVNLSHNASPEDMVSIRLFVNKNTIISTRRRTLTSVREIVTELETQQGPTSIERFLVSLITKLTYHMSQTVNEIEDKVADLEELALDNIEKVEPAMLAEARRQIIMLRRHFAPQRDAIKQLESMKELIPSSGLRDELSHEYDNTQRMTEELTSLSERASLINEAISSHSAEQANKRMYVLSMITAIFLPLGFITGLLGINVGGMPGSDYELAFWWVVGFIVIMAFFQWFFFKRSKWM